MLLIDNDRTILVGLELFGYNKTIHGIVISGSSHSIAVRDCSLHGFYGMSKV